MPLKFVAKQIFQKKDLKMMNVTRNTFLRSQAFFPYKSCFFKQVMKRLTFSPHAHFETFPQPAVLALVPMMLVDGAVAVASAGVRQVPAY